jgi:CheY-like chemotaxis protein/HPt (histidine-containing phosphotransfer) domain-containing protein
MTDIERDLMPAPPSAAANARPGVTEYLLAMGHELRAPLNTVIGMSGLLLDSELSDLQRQYVRNVHAAGEMLGTIINDVLDLARVSNARLQVEPIPFDLKSMIEETASALTARANERGLALRVDLRPELPRHVIGDPGRTRQVLGNLIGHAVSATSHGEVVIRVLVESDRGDQPWVRFVVEDTGIGITVSRLARVFDDYVPVDASPYRSFGVTGLGLRLSAELVRLMGGEIGAESIPGKGSKFWFALPMPVAAPTGVAAPSNPAGTQGGRALVIEADLASRARFAEQLEIAGWDVHFVDDAERVVAELREGAAVGNPYHACIFSHYAVRPAHAELACRLKADPALAGVALVMITAVGSPGEGKRLWHAGFAAYLRKPVPNEEILETLSAIEQVGPTGRGTALITRHSLAETRNAESFATEGIDEMLASLTADPTETAATAVIEVRSDEFTFEPEIDAADEQVAQAESTEAPDFDWIDPESTPNEPAGEMPSPVESVSPPGFPSVAFFAAAPWPTRKATEERPAAEGTSRVVEAWLSPAAAVTAAPVAEATEPAEPAEAIEPEEAAEAEPESSEPAAAAINGYVDAQWELHPAVEAVEGFEATKASEIAVDVEAIVESVAVTPPGADITADAEAESVVPEESLAAPIFDPNQSEAAEIEPVALESPAAFAESPEPVAVLEPPAGLEAESSPVAPTAHDPAEPDRAPVTPWFEALATMPAEDPEPPQVPEPVGAVEVVSAPEPVPFISLAPEPAVPEPAPAEVAMPEPVDVSGLDVASPALLDQLAHGAGFFTQYQVVAFLREVPPRIADIATASTRADGTRMGEALAALRQTADSIGAAQLSARVAATAATVEAGQLESATRALGEIERAFLEVRQALDGVSPTGLPADPAAIGANFVEQLSPAREGPARMLAQKLAASFVADAPKRLADLKAAVAQADGEAVQRVAQTFKGMCGLIGAEPMAKLVALTEADARLRRVAQADRYLRHIELELARVSEALERARG